MSTSLNSSSRKAALLAPEERAAAAASSADAFAEAPSAAERLREALLCAPAQRLWLLLAVAAAAHAAMFGGGLQLVGNQYAQGDPQLGPGVLFARHAAGVALYLAGVVLCPLPVGLALLQLAQLRAAWARPASLRPLGARALSAALAAAVTAACAYFAAFSWRELVHAELSFSLPSFLGGTPADALHQLLGGASFAAYVVVTALAAVVAASLAAAAPRPRGPPPKDPAARTFEEAEEASLRAVRRARMGLCARLEELALGENPLGRPHQPDGLLFALPGTGLALGVLAAVGGASTLLTCVWNFQASSYFAAMAYDSTAGVSYNLIPDAVPGQKGGLLWTVSSAAPAPGFGPSVINVKLYLDIAVYFGALGGTVALGLAALQVPALRRALHTRLGAVLLPRGVLAAHLDACAQADADHSAEEREREEAVADAEARGSGPDAATRRGARRRCCGARARADAAHFLGVPPTPRAALRRALGAPREALAALRDFSVGEAFVVAEVAALYGFWLWWWSTGYARIREEVAGYGDAHPLMHTWARVLGHMLTLTMSFLAFPVARNSVWEKAFGVPFERAIAYHRWLGALTWLLVTAHMALWWAKWALEGTLLSSAFSPVGLQVTPCGNNPGNPPCLMAPPQDDPGPDAVAGSLHVDNFTVVVAELAYLLLTAVLSVAVFCRRSNYKLFTITHHAALLFFMAAILHAWSHWYYTAAGLILYAFDKAARTAKAARAVEVVSLSHAGGVTRLVLGARALGAAGFFAGQYAFVCVPELGALEWHPFTISSSPEDALAEPGDGSEAGLAASAGTVTFHIKDMGAGTWTRRLALLAQRTAPGDAARLAVSVDGPYGRTGGYHERSTLLVVAGGIGLTPFHSLLLDLAARARRPREYGELGAVRKVHLVWVVRDLSIVRAFAATLLPLARGGVDGAAGDLFDISIYCTNRKRAEVDHDEAEIEDAESELPHDEAALLRAESFRKDGKGARAGQWLRWAAVAAGAAAAAREPPLAEVDPVAAGWVDEASAATFAATAQPGRPNLGVIFADVAAQARRRSEIGREQSLHRHATAMVCGPAALVREVERLSMLERMDVHSEVFHW
jgi:predicted ferric reductase